MISSTKCKKYKKKVLRKLGYRYDDRQPLNNSQITQRLCTDEYGSGKDLEGKKKKMKNE